MSESEMIAGIMPLINRTARRHARGIPSPHDADDLRQELVTIAILTARKYDRCQTKWITYAYPRIVNGAVDVLRRWSGSRRKSGVHVVTFGVIAGDEPIETMIGRSDRRRAGRCVEEIGSV